MNDGIAYLVSITTGQDEIGQTVKKESRTEVFYKPRSISSNEYFRASQSGLRPSFMVEINAFEYSDEKVIEIDGNAYDIYRTYLKNADRLELYCSERTGV